MDISHSDNFKYDEEGIARLTVDCKPDTPAMSFYKRYIAGIENPNCSLAKKSEDKKN